MKRMLSLVLVVAVVALGIWSVFGANRASVDLGAPQFTKHVVAAGTRQAATPAADATPAPSGFESRAGKRGDAPQLDFSKLPRSMTPTPLPAAP